MDTIFKSNQKLSQVAFDELWNKALIVFDTNSILNIYRLPAPSKKDFLDVLSHEKVNHRIWLPFQALLEYTHNRLTVICEQKQTFSSIERIIKETAEEFEVSYNNLKAKIDKLQLKRRHSLINPDKFLDDNLLKHTHEKLQKFLDELTKLDDKQVDVNDEDETKDKLLEIFDNKIGLSFNKNELEEIYKEGEKRYKDEIPPGFKDIGKDKEKPNYYLYEDKVFLRQYGDLIMWKEIINKAKNEGLHYIIFVTNDYKEDWWTIRRGKTLGPRYELLNEIYYNAPELKIFHMYDSSNFLKYCKTNLNINIKNKTIDEARDILEIEKNNQQSVELVNVTNLLMDLSKQIPILILSKLKNIILQASIKDITICFNEILYNVKDHSANNYVNIEYKSEGDYIVMRFSNKFNTDSHAIDSTRSKGLTSIKNRMSKYGFVAHTIVNDVFCIDLYFDKSYVLSFDL